MPAPVIYNIKALQPAQIQQDTIVQSADGAIPLPFSGVVLITKGSAAAITMAAPTSGQDDGNTITFIATTAFIHVITSAVKGFNAKGSSGTATWAAAKGNSVTMVAYKGDWYVKSSIGVTIA